MDSFLMSAVTMVGYQLPELLAAVFAMLMFALWTPQAPGRPQARTGAALMLASAVLRVGVSVAQAWVLHRAAQESSTSIGTLMGAFGAVSMLLTLVAVAGFVLIVLAARKAMSGPALA